MERSLQKLKDTLWHHLEIALEKQKRYEEDSIATMTHRPGNLDIEGRKSIGTLSSAIAEVEKTLLLQKSFDAAAAEKSFKRTGIEKNLLNPPEQGLHS